MHSNIARYKGVKNQYPVESMISESRSWRLRIEEWKKNKTGVYRDTKKGVFLSSSGYGAMYCITIDRENNELIRLVALSVSKNIASQITNNRFYLTSGD